jgi:uncharacterized protein YjbI with pentapeptide repeats
MASEEQLKILRQGVVALNAWREEHRREEVDLRGAILKGHDLIGANLSGADLSGAVLYEA